jgi:excisionase family DNA binding protein
MEQIMKPLLDVKRMAKLLAISEFTTRKLARNGKIPGATKVGGVWRFDPDKLTEAAKHE